LNTLYQLHETNKQTKKQKNKKNKYTKQQIQKDLWIEPASLGQFQQNLETYQCCYPCTRSSLFFLKKIQQQSIFNNQNSKKRYWQ